MILTMTLIAVLLKLAILTKYWCWLQHGAFWFTVATYYLQLYFYEEYFCSWPFAYSQFECDGSFLYILETPIFYFSTLCLVTFALMPDLVCRVAFSIPFAKKLSLPTPVHELCSPGNSAQMAATATAQPLRRRPHSLISHTEDEWIELLTGECRERSMSENLTLKRNLSFTPFSATKVDETNDVFQ